jgi:hypothetical protein
VSRTFTFPAFIPPSPLSSPPLLTPCFRPRQAAAASERTEAVHCVTADMRSDTFDNQIFSPPPHCGRESAGSREGWSAACGYLSGICAGGATALLPDTASNLQRIHLYLPGIRA